jgi:hypothetical protein
MRIFDFASPDTHSPQRFTTTVPQQALFLLNSPFVIEQARALTARQEATAKERPVERIDALYRLIFGRSPLPKEREMSLAFVERSESKSNTLGRWEMLAQVLLLSNEFAFID